MRVIIKVGRSCNNNCTFCHASDRRRGDEPCDRVEAKVRRARELGANMVILSGGEPTLHPRLLDFASAVARDRMQLGLITNGRRLAAPDLVDSLIHQGLTYAYVSLHGPNAAVHDSIVRTRAFDDTLSAIRNLHRHVPELTINTVVTRANIGVLNGVVDLLREFPDACIKFTFPQPKGAALDAFDDVVPSLSEAAMAVARAIAHGDPSAQPSPARFGLEGFPACVVPALEHLRNDFETHEIIYLSEPDDDDLVRVDSLAMYPDRCGDCAARARCPGIYRGYVEKRGDAEVQPIGASSAASDVSRDDLRHREQAAHERRQWVRLTYACNNRCRFCLDRDTGRTDARRDEPIKREIIEGRRAGAERLLLSGGEPTTHPRFTSFVRLGKRAGYRWVQTVTNGRMLAYPKFLAAVIAAGLDEVTVSMHGHTAELHDQLVGVPGAFDQASKGVLSALASRRLVVNVDIVINALNVDCLPEMLETFVGWGVREFDLLHIIPFGEAWTDAGRRDLFYDLAEHQESIGRALAFCQREGIQLWLNRFPPAHAEGFEYLIQDPHKLQDEVRGRLQAFETFVAGGPHLPCRAPERCARCYLEGLCDAFTRVREMTRSGEVFATRVHALHRSPGPSAQLTEIRAANIHEAISIVETTQCRGVRLRLVDTKGCVDAANASDPPTIRGVPIRQVVALDASQLDDLVDASDSIDIVVELNRSTAGRLHALSSIAHRVIVEQPTYALLTEAVDNDVDIRGLFKTLGYQPRTAGIAPCLSGIEPLDSIDVLDAMALRSDGTVDPMAFASVYARDQFFVKSLRCVQCRWDTSCRGMHLNWVRAHGFAALEPVKRDDEGD